MKNIINGLIVLLIIIFVITGFYLFFKEDSNEKNITSQENMVEKQPTPEIPSPPLPPVPKILDYTDETLQAENYIKKICDELNYKYKINNDETELKKNIKYKSFDIDIFIPYISKGKYISFINKLINADEFIASEKAGYEFVLRIKKMKNIIFSNVNVSFEKFNVAIVIDDVGYNFNVLENFLGLNVKLNFAVLPNLRYSKKSAEAINNKDLTVMMHLPLEPMNSKLKVPDAITTKMTKNEIREQFDKNLKSIPYVSGVNNHMGSRATADKRVMNIVLDLIKENKLFFIDSRTTSKSVAYNLALQKNINSNENSCFLDNKHKTDYIYNRLKVLIDRAENKKITVAIGHNRIETYNALKKIIEEDGVFLNFISLKEYYEN